MEAFWKFYQTCKDTPVDPRVHHWKLVGSPIPTLLIIALYLLLILKILPAYMKNRKPFNLTTIIKFYNVFQIIACICLLYMFYTSGWSQGEIKFGCAPVDYSSNPNPVKMLEAFYWLHWLKMVEMIETVFFILRKKDNQVSALHIYHHASTFFLTYVGCKYMGGGMVSFPVMVNSFIHILMYSYYYMSSLGPEWQKTLAPWKPKLTMAQMIQFSLLIVHGLTALPSSCNISKKFLLIYLPNVVIIFKMFYDFYAKTYYQKKEKLENIHTNQSKQNGLHASQNNKNKQT